MLGVTWGTWEWRIKSQPVFPANLNFMTSSEKGSSPNSLFFKLIFPSLQIIKSSSRLLGNSNSIYRCSQSNRSKICRSSIWLIHTLFSQVAIHGLLRYLFSSAAIANLGHRRSCSKEAGALYELFGMFFAVICHFAVNPYCQLLFRPRASLLVIRLEISK
jgi:hypothetical protein